MMHQSGMTRQLRVKLKKKTDFCENVFSNRKLWGGGSMHRYRTGGAYTWM